MNRASQYFSKVSLFRRKERGFAEVAAAIFVLPLLIALVFTLIELGWYLRYRTMVEEATRITTVMVAAEGSQGRESWSALQSFPAGWQSQNWSNYGTEQLRKLCHSIPAQTTSGGSVSAPVPSGDTGIRCRTRPAMVCQGTPGNRLDLFPTASEGNRVQCRSTFYYQTLTSLGRSPVFSFGFNNLFEGQPIEVTVTSVPSVVRGR